LINLPSGIQKILPLLQSTAQYYLVGGAVRDALLSRSSQDLDIVCTCDTRTIGRKLADQVSGSFFMLDDERNACRVICKANGGQRLVFDFTQLRGTDLESDLKERDFTINAMAVDLADPTRIIDPLRGGRDLVEKWLRPCTESSFTADPLRVIRAVRYSVKYDLRLEPSTVSLLKQAVDKLGSVSKERRRDELFKILENDKPCTAVELMNHFRMLPYFSLAGIPDFDTALTRLRVFSQFNSFIQNKDHSSNTENFLLSSFVMGFKHDRGFIKDHLSEVNLSDRSKKGLDELALLLWNVDLSAVERIVEELALSKEEQLHIISLLENRNAVTTLLTTINEIDNRTLFQYYQPLGNRGVDLALLSMVDNAGCLSAEINEDHWIRLLELSRKIIDTWIEHPEIVDPKPLVNGKDLMFEFDLLQGPMIGQLLDGLREEQVAGVIRTRKEALDWIEQKLQSGLFT
jgi:poly(A) polymerase